MTKGFLFRGRTFAAALAAAGAAACSGSKAAVRSSVDPPTVAVAPVVRSDLAQTLDVAAEFKPYQEIDVHAKVAGYVKAIYVDVGDRVRTGALLAELEIPELRDELQQDEATVKRSAEEIKRAQADLERTESAHEVAHLSATRLEAVIKQRPNLVAQQDIDDATGRDRVAEAQVATAKAALAAAEQQLEVSKASANRTRTLSAYARITAPFDGVITRRYADTGAMIQAGTSSQTQAMPVVRLSENDRLRLIIPVPESAVSRIHVGESVDVRVDALGRQIVGKVARFAGRLDLDTRTMDTEVDVPNKDLTLVPGMYADAGLALDHTTGALTIPVQALDRTDQKASVIVVKDSRVERRDVQVGLELPDRVELRSGVAEGELVVLANRGQLRPGMSVSPKIQPAAAREPR